MKKLIIYGAIVSTLNLSMTAQSWAQENKVPLSIEETKKRIEEFNKDFLPPYEQIAEEIEIHKAPVQEIYRGVRFSKAPRCDLAKSALAIQYCQYVDFKDFEPGEIKTWKLYIDEAIALGGGPLFQAMEKNGFRLFRSVKSGNLKRNESGGWEIGEEFPEKGFTKVHSAGYVQIPDYYSSTPLFAEVIPLSNGKRYSFGAYVMLSIGEYAFDKELVYSNSPEFLVLLPYTDRSKYSPFALPDTLEATLTEIETKNKQDFYACVGNEMSPEEAMKNLNLTIPCTTMAGFKYHDAGLKLGFPDWSYSRHPQDFFAKTLERILLEPQTLEGLNPAAVDFVKMALYQEAGE